MSNRWTEVAGGVYQFTDSCLVYAVDTGEAMLVINAGTGAWVNHLGELPRPVRWVALTHFFRDHSAGALAAVARGIEVWAPYWEQEQLADSLGLFARRETYIIYDNNWDLFAPVAPLQVTRWLRDWEEIEIGAATLTVLPTPGVSLGAITFGVQVNGRRIALCGELIHSPGKILRVAPLQYNYQDLSGAQALLYSIGVVQKWGPGTLLSSTGADPIEDPEPALRKLDVHLRAALAPRPDTRESVEAATNDVLDRVTEHVYQSRYGEASTYFLISENGKALAIDYGYRGVIGHGGGYPFPRNRRPLLHGVEALKRDHGIEGIDAVLVTHFHDDHVNGIPMLQRLYGTRCYAGANFADMLARPDRYAFPCTWPEPIDVESVPLDSSFAWEEYRFRLHAISGHTRFSTLVEFEVDGKLVVATGDQYFFTDFERPGESSPMHNHVFRNGAVLSSFADSTAIMGRIHPQIILPGHGAAYEVPEELFDSIESYTRDYERIHSDLMPLSDDAVHFEVDSRAAWIEPYRVRIDSPAPIEFTVHVRNPYPTRSTLRVVAVVPDGWGGSAGEIILEPRAEGTLALRITPPPSTTCRRQPIAVELTGAERSFGQVAEALVTIGNDRF